MSIAIVAAALLLLILQIGWLKIHPFIAFLVTALLAGWWLGIPPVELPGVVKKGIGSMMSDVVIVIVAGAMLGKLIAETGAAATIADSLTRLFGNNKVQWALMVTGFIVGIPLFYNVGFVLLVPLAFAIIYRTGLPAVYTALPMLAALSVTHGFLPPHPSPMAIGAQLQANTGQVLLYGILISVPAILVAGPMFANRFKHFSTPSLALFQPKAIASHERPRVFISFFVALLPAIALMLFALLSYSQKELSSSLRFWSEPSVVMLASLLVAAALLGWVRGVKLSLLLEYFGDAIKDISVILLIIAGAGALKQVLADSGVSASIGQLFQSANMHPLLLGWLIAAVIRICVGSATVAGLTAAGIIAPMAGALAFHPALMVLSIGAGSLFMSHVNDSGFWMFKEYFNLSVKDTLRTWTVMECIVSVTGLVGVLILNAVLG
jgi:Gnt-I system high-affinity gluconate transporter